MTRLDTKGEVAGETGTVIPNKGQWVDKAVQLFIILSYPVAIWFGLCVIRFWPSFVGFTVVWLFLLLYWRSTSYQVSEICVRDSSLTAKFRKGEKEVPYNDIVRIEWGGDFAGKGILIALRNEEVIAINGIDDEIMNKVLMEIYKARPDFGLGRVHHGLFSTFHGEAADKDHKNTHLLLSWSESFAMEFLYWGYRPKKAKR